MHRVAKGLHRLGASIVDSASFGFINFLQATRPLPDDLCLQFNKYLDSTSTETMESYHSIETRLLHSVRLTSGRLCIPSLRSCDFQENNQAAFDLFPCEKGWAAPTMFLGHGLMSVSDVGYRRWARRLNELGWNAIFIHLPYHYSRRPKGYLSGELAAGPHVVRTAEALRQAVMDCRLMLHLLEREGCTKVGGWGTSFGGWVFALLACVDARLKRLILVEPILNAGNAIWYSPAGRGTRLRLRQHRISAKETDRHNHLCCPSHSRPLMEGRHILLMAGEYDKVVTPAEVEALHKAWPDSHYRCFPQGHVGYRLMPESFRLAQELWPEDFVA